MKIAICFCQRLIKKVGHFEGCSCIQISIFRMKYFISKRHYKLLFFPSVSTNDSESYMNEEKKEDDLLNKCMQSMSIEEHGEHLMLTWQSWVLVMCQRWGEGIVNCVLSLHSVLLFTTKSLSNFSLFRNFYYYVNGLM